MEQLLQFGVFFALRDRFFGAKKQNPALYPTPVFDMIKIFFSYPVYLVRINPN